MFWANFVILLWPYVGYTSNGKRTQICSKVPLDLGSQYPIIRVLVAWAITVVVQVFVIP